MKKSVLFFVFSIFVCANCISQENANDQFFEFSNCIYTTENYVTGMVGHSIILGDKTFSPKSDSLHNEAQDSFCLYFSINDVELKKGITNIRSEDGAFEGSIIDHGQEIEFKLASPLECTYDGEKIHMKGTASLYESETSARFGNTFSFVYDGPVSEGLFLDLWLNPSYQIKK